MILDNRLVPDIIVSREHHRNIQQQQHQQHQQPPLQPHHVNNNNNNNGSPHHVHPRPLNANHYPLPPAGGPPPLRGVAAGVVAPPGSNNNGSPRHRTSPRHDNSVSPRHNCNRNRNIPMSPRHIFRSNSTTNCLGSPRHLTTNGNGSPMHQKVVNVYYMSRSPGSSPRHVPAQPNVGSESKTSQYGSSQDIQKDQDAAMRTPSKIPHPIHIQENTRERTSSLDRLLKDRSEMSPRKSPFRGRNNSVSSSNSSNYSNGSSVNRNQVTQKNLDTDKGDLKAMAKNYSLTSPKRSNVTINKVIGNTSKDKPGWQQWHRRGEAPRWSTPNGKLNIESSKFNRNLSVDQEDLIISDGSDKWNLNRSEEENDQVFLTDESRSDEVDEEDRHISQPHLTTPEPPKGTIRRVSLPLGIESTSLGSDGRSNTSMDSRGSTRGSHSGSDWDSGVDSVTSKMVLIKCKDANYLTRIFVNDKGIHALKVVGRVGVSGSTPGHVMSEGQSGSATPGFPSQNDDAVTKTIGDVMGRENQSDIATSYISQVTDNEFEHETADYQWLLDYEYRESYSRVEGPTSIGGSWVQGRDGSGRVSVLDPSGDLSYETLARNLDANLAEIDMDDFRSEDIHNLLALPTMCGEFQDADEGECFASVSGSMMNRYELDSSVSPHSSTCQPDEEYDHEYEEEDDEDDDHQHERRDDHCDGEEDGDEEYSGVSSSMYQSGPLFSPLKEPPTGLGNVTFSVDSLDCSLHDDLILTCQANKDNYTIAFEGSYIQYSEDSDYHDTGESDSQASGCSSNWVGERLEGRMSAPAMTHSDQPYTTWSRVSRRNSRTPEMPSRATQNVHPPRIDRPENTLMPQVPNGSKSNSMPNLMRRSIMRRSLEAANGCVKVFDLQNSMRSSQNSGRQTSGDANNLSLLKLFMKQKSLSKEGISLSSSCSQEGACSSSDSQSNVQDSSDWVMQSQSENDMDGSSSPVPAPALQRQYGLVERGYRRRSGSVGAPEITTINNENTTAGDSDNKTNNLTTNTNVHQDRVMNNNNIIPVNAVIDNNGVPLSSTLDNVTSFEDSLRETSPCSKAPVTSPIREEPEGMDISVDSGKETKLKMDQVERENQSHEVLLIKDYKNNVDKNNMSSGKNGNKNISKNAFNILVDERKRSQSPGTPKKNNAKRVEAGVPTSAPRRRQDSGNSSSGYVSNKGSTEKIRRASDSDGSVQGVQQKPRPKPRVIKQFSDAALQTSNYKVSTMVNTSGYLDKKEVYVYYPNYALPDLSFLKDKKYNVDAKVFLVPQHYQRHNESGKPPKDSKNVRRPFSCSDMEKLRKHGFNHIRDWDSLNFLLPKELKEMLLDETECMETIKPSFCQSPKPSKRPVSCEYSGNRCGQQDLKGSNSSNSTQPSSGYRGSSTMLNESEEPNTPTDPRYVYKYDSAISESAESVEKPPPLPKRSISLPVEEKIDGLENPPPRPPLPRGILRKSLSKDDAKGARGHNKRYSATDTGKCGMREDLLKRRSLQEPMEYMVQRAAQGTIPKVSKQEDEKERPRSPPSQMGCSCVTTACTGFCSKGLKKKNLLRVSELPDVSSHEDLTEDDLLKLRAQVSNLLVTKGNQMGNILGDTTLCDLCPKKSVSFAEKSRGLGDGATNNDDEARPLVFDTHDKKTLLLSVRASVEKLVQHFATATTKQEKINLGTSSTCPIVAQITLEKLCPAIYALLSDGLHPSLQSLFGKINNSVWRFIEVTSQMSPSTKALNDLVLTLNSEECLSEGPIKFNAFIFGLLNIRSLDSWMGYLRTRESLIQKHYHPEAFLYLANTATRALFDELCNALRPLTGLPFNLDLLHEYKALHASLQKMEERMFQHTSSKDSPIAERPPSVLDHLLASKETKEFKNAVTQQDRVKALMRVLTSPEAEESELLRSIAERTSQERSKSPRPRSCYEHVAAEEANSTHKKRWSNVQLGSKLLTAIDKLMMEEGAGHSSSEDYTDSLDNPKINRKYNQQPNSDDEVETDLHISDISREEDCLTERSATEKDTENEKGNIPGAALSKDDSEGVKFRRLQMKWEQMADQDSKASSANSTPSKVPSSRNQERPQQLPESLKDKAPSPGAVGRSRIPRPVSLTSPQRPWKTFEPAKGHKAVSAPPKELPKPAPRKSLKEKAPNNQQEDLKSPGVRPPSVRSRLAPRPTSSPANITTTTVRASSVPSRGDKNNVGKSDSQRRYGSQQRSHSSGRRVNPGDTPRLVQTLHHRMATDSGHLSFNRGDILTLVVEVDDRYLLCCLRDRKGLVPRASVIVYEQ